MTLPAADPPERAAADEGAAADERPSARRGRQAWLWALLMILPAAVALRLLALGAFAGPSVRPAADDWCAVGRISQYGVGMIDYYYQKVNGRLAYHAATVVVFADGLRGARVLPFVLVVTLALGTFTVLYIVLRHLRWRWAAAAAGLVSVVVSALTFFAGNVVYQAIYWPAATVTHTLPAILGIWGVVIFLVAARSPRRWARGTAIALSCLLGFTIGTLGEAFFVVSGVYAGAALVLAVAAWRDRRSRFPIAWLSAWLGGLLAGFAVLYTSPGQSLRTSYTFMHTQPSLLSASGFADAFDQWQKTWASIASQPAYYAAIAAGLLVGLLASSEGLRGTSLPFSGGSWTRARKTLVVTLPAGLVAVSSFAVIAGVRHGYGPNGWSYERAWTNFLIPALVTAALYGAAAGYWLGRRVNGWQPAFSLPAMGTLLVVTALLSTVWLGSLVPSNAELAQAMTVRAQAWDKNNGAVERQVRDGRSVVRFTPVPIANLTEPFRYTNAKKDWAANCAAAYYGVERLVPSKAWLSTPASAVYRSKNPGR